VYLQVHLYDQSVMTTLQKVNEHVPLAKVDPNVKINVYVNDVKPPQVHKLPFNLLEELSYFDTSYMNDSRTSVKRAG